MIKTKIRCGDLVVVCDSRKALLLENIGDERFLNLHTRRIFEHDNPPTHLQGVSAPGRVHQSSGSARSAVEQTDWHIEAERQFLQALERELAVAVASAPATRLIVVAPPRALGMLRHLYSPAVRHAASGEFDMDWVKMPIPRDRGAPASLTAFPRPTRGSRRRLHRGDPIRGPAQRAPQVFYEPI
jgi:protein required for attachment to host cells